MGHLVPHRELIAALLKRGHTVHVAARDVGRAGAAFEGLPLHYWPVPLSLDLPTKIYQPTVSLAHILHNVGFANATDVTLRIAAWRNLLTAIRPNVLLADYGPTALLAVRGSAVKAVVIGMGFCLPPDATPLPAFATLAHGTTVEQLSDDESRVTLNMNSALQQHGLPKIQRLADTFYDTHAQVLTTVAELDHYPARGQAEYWGLSPERAGKSVAWPAGTGRRVFAYLKPFPAIEALFELLNQLELPSIIACDGLSESLRHRHRSATLNFTEGDVDIARLAVDCYVAITNGSHTTTARFLLAGKPVVMIPLQLEQELVAHAVTSLGLGLTVRPNEPQNLFPQLATILNSAVYHRAAADLASKYAAGCSDRLDRLIDVIEKTG